MSLLYVFVDPFASDKSGVTSYVAAASKLVESCGIATKIIARSDKESLVDFKKRVSGEINFLSGSIIVEIPETLACSALIVRKDIRIHVRLHCTKAIGDALQGFAINEKHLAAEQLEITRADWVSAPSAIAVAASKYFFCLPDKVYVYPNPIEMPELFGSVESNERAGISFLGRWQKLKGSSFIADISKKMPGEIFKFGVDRQPVGFQNNTYWHKINGNAERMEFLMKSKVLILPSLFETFSMVGLESIACRTPVVTWDHVGIGEYFKPPYIYVAKPYDVDDFVNKIHTAVSVEIQHDTELIKINSAFKNGVVGIVSGVDFGSVFLDRYHDWEDLLMASKNIAVRNNKSGFIRKLKKLRDNPGKFVMDSNFVRLFIRPGGRVQKGKDLKAKETLSRDVSSLDLSKIASFARVESDGKIQITINDCNLHGLKTAILFPEGFLAAGDLLKSLWAFSDFRPFCDGYVHVGTYNLPESGEALDIINRIDLANKQKLGGIDLIFIFDSPEYLIEALRNCAANLRVINVSAVAGSRVADAEIVSVNSECPKYMRRCVFVDDFSSADQVAVAMRRVAQDFKRRDIDLLLPVITCNIPSAELFSFDVNIYQGIICVDSMDEIAGKSLSELVVSLSSKVTGLMLIESVYLRYKNMCENIERGGCPDLLILACLEDGVLFDVRF